MYSEQLAALTVLCAYCTVGCIDHSFSAMECDSVSQCKLKKTTKLNLRLVRGQWWFYKIHRY